MTSDSHITAIKTSFIFSVFGFDCMFSHTDTNLSFPLLVISCMFSSPVIKFHHAWYMPNIHPPLKLDLSVFFPTIFSGSCDFVELLDSAQQQIEVLRGYKPLYTVTVNGNRTDLVKIRFDSDSSVRRKGFLAQYHIITCKWKSSIHNLNCHILGFHPQALKLEPPCTA